jgi:hypothetical protein
MYTFLFTIIGFFVVSAALIKAMMSLDISIKQKKPKEGQEEKEDKKTTPNKTSL